MSTNDIMLHEDRLNALYESGLRHLVITLHTLDSLENYLKALHYFDSKSIALVPFEERHKTQEKQVMYFSGKVIDFSEGIEQGKQVREAIKSLPESAKRYLKITPTHTWAGNVFGSKRFLSEESVIEKQQKCYFIQRKVVNMRWDGTIVGCCFDSEKIRK